VYVETYRLVVEAVVVSPGASPNQRLRRQNPRTCSATKSQSKRRQTAKTKHPGCDGCFTDAALSQRRTKPGHGPFLENNLAFSCADSASLRAACAFQLPDRHRLGKAISELAAQLKVEMKAILNGPVVLACDGGTLHRQPMLNFAMMILPTKPGETPQTYYVCSRRVDDGKAATIKSNIRAVKRHVELTYGVHPIAIVTDNASAMAAGIAQEAEEELDEDGPRRVSLFVDEQHDEDEFEHSDEES
jgi:hypothetical protein